MVMNVGMDTRVGRSEEAEKGVKSLEAEGRPKERGAQSAFSKGFRKGNTHTCHKRWWQRRSRLEHMTESLNNPDFEALCRCICMLISDSLFWLASAWLPFHSPLSPRRLQSEKTRTELLKFRCRNSDFPTQPSGTLLPGSVIFSSRFSKLPSASVTFRRGGFPIKWHFFQTSAHRGALSCSVSAHGKY